ncbi:glycosyltransferase family 4 protein [Maridesulfovibrio salexigens]|uniref:Glycosyl transferase group 1 n=1 Tax=Maridesulfovibrio salexigens (strain ATCC 14822 / DSM 2638 / NCIMB 8403 / VKM B-1763) TaxID=526222 RepID=C6C1R4_MARSD|nr:glycosyltransferase family 4 protein [Maridesulfovibrio salexigens]ACS79310.1 glycosyl transferase group 1 [Maridesulfovibrio salexigens DSM 2638]
MEKNRIRVLQVSPSLGLGGTEKVMQSFAVNLDRKIFHTATYSPANGPRGKLIREQGIETFVGTDLLSVLHKFQPQVVHIHRAGWAEPGSLRPFKLAKTPLLVETNVFGHHDPSPEGELIDRHLFVSNFCAKRYAAVNSIPTVEPKYSVLYNPVDTDFFLDKCPHDREIPADSFGRISRADKGKWSILALDFLPILKEKIKNQQITPFQYRIIGGIPDAEKYVADHNLESLVNFLPPVLTDSEIAEFLNSISFLVHANDTGESFGLVIAEAMAAGLPVITHPSKEMRDNAQLELVDHGETGFVAHNALEFAQYIRFLLTNPKEARKMGENGRAKAAKLFRAQDIAFKLGNIYLDLLKMKKAI